MTKNEETVVNGRLEWLRPEKRTLEPFVHQVSLRVLNLVNDFFYRKRLYSWASIEGAIEGRSPLKIVVLYHNVIL